MRRSASASSLGPPLQLLLQPLAFRDLLFEFVPPADGLAGVGLSPASGRPQSLAEQADGHAEEQEAGHLNGVPGQAGGQRVPRRQEEVSGGEEAEDQGQEGRPKAAVPGHRHHGQAKEQEGKAVTEQRIQEQTGHQGDGDSEHGQRMAADE